MAAASSMAVPATEQRKELFLRRDSNGNGGLSLAEIDRAAKEGVLGKALGVADGQRAAGREHGLAVRHRSSIECAESESAMRTRETAVRHEEQMLEASATSDDGPASTPRASSIAYLRLNLGGKPCS